MKAYEFPSKVTPEGKLELPETLQTSLKSEQVVKVIVLVSEQEDIEDKKAWSTLTSKQFLVAYSNSDAIYDQI
ncbi:hypothetical protein Cri9333_2996 [Crinalium epipsammum PCC 9333]|uniref:Uncharacterized protein n=1 Tax=Crinalium epipsammum PCC 9333 TaxID=1173022 RepID=K9W324_9CYAN|nr:hypothetical protein [Crinalium epipsammum]AFZ13835.1 hypothetical protein Cri9333_2996 [Crinalium epipsammum PCC 9333]